MTRYVVGFCAGWLAAWTLRALWLRIEAYDAKLAADASAGRYGRPEAWR